MLMMSNALSFDQPHEMPVPPQAEDVKCMAALRMPTLPKVNDKDLFMKIPASIRQVIEPIMKEAVHERQLVAMLDEVLDRPIIRFEFEGIEYEREGYSKWVDYAVAYWKATHK